MRSKDILIFLYLAIGVSLFFAQDFELWVLLTFAFNYIITGSIFFYHLYFERSFSPFLSAYCVFVFLFLILAPVVQIISLPGFSTYFKTFLPYTVKNVITVNVLILIFQVIFFLFYLLLTASISRKLTKPELPEKRTAALIISVLTIFCVLILLYNIPFIIEEMERPSWIKFDVSIAHLLIRKKVLFILPLPVIFLSHIYLNKKVTNKANYYTVLCCVVICIITLLIFKNPTIEKRNAIGPVVFCLLFIFKRSWLNTNGKVSAFLFFSLVVAFPLSALITHSDYSFEKLVSNPKLLLEKNEGLFETFNTLHYDAYSNIGATVDYVDINGHTNGHQLASTLFFFVPRSIWPNKATPTGQLVGNHLIEHHRFDYNNLSNPIISEGYIDFDIWGVILIAIILACLFWFFQKWLLSKDLLKQLTAFYFSIHLIFLLRGDLTNGYSYFVGTFIGIYVIPKLIILLFSNASLQAIFSFAKTK